MSRNQRRKRRNSSGSSQTASRNGNRVDAEDRSAGTVLHRASTETKSSLKTTELIAYVAAVLAVIMTALAVDERGQDGNDPFGAESAIRYITYLTIGYMIARGLAKSGSYENRDVDNTGADDDDARTDVTDVEDARVDDGDDQPESDAEDVDTAPSSPEMQHAGSGSSDARS